MNILKCQLSKKLFHELLLYRLHGFRALSLKISNFQHAFSKLVITLTLRELKFKVISNVSKSFEVCFWFNDHILK